jgi:prophage regulatory protein
MDFPKLVRLDTVLEMTTLSVSTIYRLMKKGQFPRQIKISERSTRWVLDEIFEWMDGNFKSRDEGES